MTDETVAAPNRAVTTPPEKMETLLEIMARLRDPATGCPWDVEQDFASIAPYTIEEAYEVADAVQRDDMDDLCDELGDLLLQVVFHAQMAKEKDLFGFHEVVAAISNKMIRRHPHVFGDIDRDDPQAVKVRWEAIKAEERAEKRARKGQAHEHTTAPASALDGVPNTLPPIQRSFKLQQKAARVGFDWPDAKSVLAKLHEETQEVEDEIAADPVDKDKLADEIGDLLFVVTNLARKLDVDPAVALERTNQKFIRRFQWVEDSLRNTPEPVGSASLEQMEEAWLEAKQHTR